MRYLLLFLLLSLPALAQDSTYYPPPKAYHDILARADSVPLLKRTVASQQVTISRYASGETKRQENTSLLTGAVILLVVVGIVLMLIKE